MEITKTICLALPIAFGGAAFFEHFRHWITHPHRQFKLRTYWEVIGTDEGSSSLKYMKMLFDYLTLPIASMIEWLIPGRGIKWKQKFYHSLSVAGRFVNPFIEWEDRNTTDLFQYLKWRLTRNNRNGVPDEDVEIN